MNQKMTINWLPCILLLAGVFAVSLSSAVGDDKAVLLTGNDLMQLNTKAFTVSAGDTVKLTFKHVGKLPKIAMGHNIVILKPGVDVAKFAQEAATAVATDYIPAGREGDIVAMTKMVGGGEEDTITFQAPPPGNYVYICTFPGHYVLMQGVMTVK